MSDKAYHAIMKIEDVNVEDAGKYKVIAKNELGESNASICLNFDGKQFETLIITLTKFYLTP